MEVQLSPAARDVYDASKNPLFTDRAAFGRVWTILTVAIKHEFGEFPAEIWVDTSTGIMSMQPQLTAMFLNDTEAANGAHDHR